MCPSVEETVVIAGLCRALVETAASEWAAGEPPPPVPTLLLRLGAWQASREGIDGVLLDPFTSRPVPAWDVVDRLVDHVRPALKAAGDLEAVEDGLERLRREGNGAIRQRRMYERTGQLVDVVAHAVRVTAGLEDAP